MKKRQNKVDIINEEKDKFYWMFRFMDDWMNKKIRGLNVEDYLLKRNYSNIAIYGMSYIGQTLINELENSKISIKYGIDRDAEVYWDTFPIKRPNQITDDVDAIIVTTVMCFDEIRHTIRERVKCPVISLEEIVDAM